MTKKLGTRVNIEILDAKTMETKHIRSCLITVCAPNKGEQEIVFRESIDFSEGEVAVLRFKL